LRGGGGWHDRAQDGDGERSHHGTAEQHGSPVNSDWCPHCARASSTSRPLVYAPMD
jgi:hypothetical protein